MREELTKISEENEAWKLEVNELQNRNMELQEDRARLEGMVMKEKKHYEEMSVISDDMEKELLGHKEMIRQLNIKLQEKSKESKQKVCTYLLFL